MIFAGDEASVGDVVIIEIMQNPSAVSDANGEWFEIYNNTGSTIDINGWTIKDNGSNSHVISNGGSLNISAGSVLVLGKNNNTGTNGNYTCNYQYSSFTLGNGDDEVILLDNSGDGIDSVYYDGGTDFPDPTGASMTLNVNTTTNLYKLNNVGSNWTTESTSTYGDGDSGTPGSVGGDQSLPVELLKWYGRATNTYIQLNWETASEIDNLGFLIYKGVVGNPLTLWQDYRSNPSLNGQGSTSFHTKYSLLDRSVIPDQTYVYLLSDMDIHGIETRHDTIKVKLNFKKQFTVFSNPTNPEIQMVLNLDANSHIQIDIYNILGHLVESIFQGETQSGEHSISWDGSKFSSGYYLVTLRINDHLASSQGITILK